MGRRVTNYTQIELVRAVDQFTNRLYAVAFKRAYLGYRIQQTASRMAVHNVLNIPFYQEPPVSGDWISRAGTDLLPNPAGLGENVVTGYATNRLFAIGSSYNELQELQDQGDPSVIWQRSQQRGMETAWAMARALSNGLVNGLGGKQPDGIFFILEALAEAAQTGSIMGLSKATYPFLRNRFVSLTNRAGYLKAGTQLPALVVALINLIAACSSGARVPTDIVTNKATFDTLRRCFMEMSSAYHLISDANIVANVGIGNFTIEGMNVAWDAYVPRNRIAVLQFSNRLDAQRRLGIQLQGEVRDLQLEQNVLPNLIDTDSPALAMFFHPNIQGKRLAPRIMGARSNVLSEWMITSANNGFIRPNELGILSDTESGNLMESF